MSNHDPATATGPLAPLHRFLRERREARRQAEEVVGLMWVWDHVEPMTREQAEFYELNLLPLGWSILNDHREESRLVRR